VKLSHFSQGRDNNFNLIRIIAALAVLVTHSFAVATGNWDAEPLSQSIGMTMGEIAVDVFFITSGFLVTASLLIRQNTIEFVWARALRIYPALMLMLFLTVFILGPCFTSLHLSAYLSDGITYRYLAKCGTLFAGVNNQLPGVFDGNPCKNAVNGSLWTMPFEIRMYAILALAWLALRIMRQYRLKALSLCIMIYAVLSGIYVLGSRFDLFPTRDFARLSFMFFTGATFYVLKEHIIISRRLFGLMIIMLAFSICWDKRVFYVVYILSLAYLVLFLAYVPSGHIRRYNLLGDYSYGIYIYAFPVQQTVAALIPGVSVTSMILISAAATIFLAAMSWHLLERRALALKGAYIGNVKKWLSFRPLFMREATGASGEGGEGGRPRR
jgi:peptidoglycan/LPS O-acetylase OafA/YrhL